MKRIKKRKKRNRYDKFTKSFYNNVQKAFIKIAKRDKKRYFIVDNSNETKETERVIFSRFNKLLSK